MGENTLWLESNEGNTGNLVIRDDNNKKMVVIPHVVFKGKRSISWKQVEQYLISYVGKIFEVSETKDLIYIDKSFADEYAGSVYTQKLRGALPKVKANNVTRNSGNDRNCNGKTMERRLSRQA